MTAFGIPEISYDFVGFIFGELMLFAVDLLRPVGFPQPPPFLRMKTPELIRRYPLAFCDRRLEGLFDEAGLAAAGEFPDACP